MCAKALLSLRSNAKRSDAPKQSVSDRTKRYESRIKTKAIKPKPKPIVQEDECSREERYERRCQAKAADEKREIAKMWRKNVLPVLKQMR